MNLPIETGNLPAVDYTIVEAVAVEHEKSTTKMARTLRGFGWSPMQCAYVEDRWAWAQIARAVVAERTKNGLAPALAATVAALMIDTPSAKLRADEKAWEEKHGPTASPRPPGGPIFLPKKPPTTADASVYLSDPATPGSQEPTL